jgi:hypothetical protein
MKQKKKVTLVPYLRQGTDYAWKLSQPWFVNLKFASLFDYLQLEKSNLRHIGIMLFVQRMHHQTFNMIVTKHFSYEKLMEQ